MNNAHFCEFRLRTAMHLAQTLEVKGDINLESAQVYPAMGASMNFPNMGGQIPFVQPSFPQPSFPQPTFPQPFGGSGVNVNFGFPSAPPAAVVTSFPVSFIFI